MVEHQSHKLVGRGSNPLLVTATLIPCRDGRCKSTAIGGTQETERWQTSQLRVLGTKGNDFSGVNKRYKSSTFSPVTECGAVWERTCFGSKMSQVQILSLRQ